MLADFTLHEMVAMLPACFQNMLHMPQPTMESELLHCLTETFDFKLGISSIFLVNTLGRGC